MSKLYIWPVLVVLMISAGFKLTMAQATELTEENRAMGFMKAVQAGDAQALLAYMNANWVPDETGTADREARFKRMATMLTERHADLEVTGITADQVHVLTIETSSPQGPALRFLFEFSVDPPHLISGMSIEAGGGGDREMDLPNFEIPANADRGAVLATLGTWFDALASQDIFSGTVLVAWRGQQIFAGAYGLASQRWQVPNNIETRFDLGSINKSFTKIAIGQLMLQGRLSLDDTIAKHLPGYPNRQVADAVTIRQLLDHSSGLGDIFNEKFFSSSKALYRKPQDFFPLFVDEPLLFEPGAQQSYSNAGFIVLGAIIEAASGESYYDYIVHRIFEPAGMTNSGFFSKDEPVENVAMGYTLADGQETRRSNLYILPVKGNSAGSAQSTVADLLKFDTALREYKLLPVIYTNWYFGGAEPQPNQAADNAPSRAIETTGIAGGAPGVSAIVESNNNLAVIVLSNYDPPLAQAVSRQLFRPLLNALNATN